MTCITFVKKIKQHPLTFKVIEDPTQGFHRYLVSYKEESILFDRSDHTPLSTIFYEWQRRTSYRRALTGSMKRLLKSYRKGSLYLQEGVRERYREDLRC